MHGGVTITISHKRTMYWISFIRKIKPITKNYFKCKRCRAMSYPGPKPGPYPKDRTEQCYPFQVVGVNYAGMKVIRYPETDL